MHPTLYSMDGLFMHLMSACAPRRPACRLAEFVLPEELRVKGYDAGLEEEDADVEAQFSDDEAVSWR